MTDDLQIAAYRYGGEVLFGLARADGWTRWAIPAPALLRTLTSAGFTRAQAAAFVLVAGSTPCASEAEARQLLLHDEPP